jgi:hypothetical protein
MWRILTTVSAEPDQEGGLEAAADAGGDSKPARFVNTTPPTGAFL